MDKQKFIRIGVIALAVIAVIAVARFAGPSIFEALLAMHGL